MSKLLRNVLITLALLVSVTASNAWTYELTDLIENKNFWTSYGWQETFEESDFYSLAIWEKSPEKWFRGDGKVVDKYITKGSIGNLNIEQQISIKLYNEKPRTIFYFEARSYNEFGNGDYTKLVNWGNERFGKVFYSYVKKIEMDDKSTRDRYYSCWILSNTIVGIEALPNQKELNGYITRLFFEKQAETESGITTPPVPDLPQKKSAESVPALRTTDNNQLPNSVDADKIKSLTKYIQPPYIWENESGVTNVTDDIINVPEDKRFLFEINIRK